MKRLIIALAFLPVVAHAGGHIFAQSLNKAGGHNYLVKDPDKCATGIGFMTVLPFQNDPIRGCVTQFGQDAASFHVFFENGMEQDYTTSEFTAVPITKTAKGAL
jgi:hypothetical protein